MKKSEYIQAAYGYAREYAETCRHEYLTPEHLLYGIVHLSVIEPLFERYHVDRASLWASLEVYMDLDNKVPEEVGDYEMLVSSQLVEVMTASELMARAAGRDEVNIPHLINAIMQLEDSQAVRALAVFFTDDSAELLASVQQTFQDESLPLDYMNLGPDADGSAGRPHASMPEQDWHRLVTCINDQLPHHNPLIGRQAELDRTIQVLCRRDKNNPLHVGEPGVGKTALVYGLAERIERDDVPPRLRGARIYQMDMASMVAGTSYRGAFEKRIKSVIEGALSEGNSIIYIDEIHTLVGAGSSGDSSLDGANILKPYLESGQLRFIGSTTYKEYNRHLQESQGMVRRFQQIDIAEPSVPEAIEILEGLRERYEQFHGVRYADGVLRYAVEASARHITGRFLPDKAIDLIDEAGAYREMHPIMRKARKTDRQPASASAVRQKTQWVDKELINDVLARICKIDPQSLREQDTQQLETLAQRISAQIYGQDQAIRQVTEAVQMGKAGLLDDQKPIASLLFVGPTGVGKTEVCRVLAHELGLSLVRFDMSEYAEKHTVAKLIGSPAGYVGYQDGGLLTDAIRKTPNCVLLLDEIEKAHSDIYNILLQVMDYAHLTDNKGQKADFRHVILIMTSNAGAQYAHQAAVGFGSQVSAGTAMLATVRKTFKPEFINRLSGTVVFNDMDRTMARLILDKKLRQLSARLAARQVTMQLTPAATDLLLNKGYTRQNGAREMDRQINTLLSPLLTRAILFGSLRQGGSVTVDAQGEQLILSAVSAM